MKFNYYFLIVLCLLSLNGFSQNAKLIGKVTEENGEDEDERQCGHRCL